MDDDSYYKADFDKITDNLLDWDTYDQQKKL